jgi:hypothetical protein
MKRAHPLATAIGTIATLITFAVVAFTQPSSVSQSEHEVHHAVAPFQSAEGTAPQRMGMMGTQGMMGGQGMTGGQLMMACR